MNGTDPIVGHTPLPWRAERRQHYSVVLQSGGKQDGYCNRVAECPQWSPAPAPQPTPEEAFANAALIVRAVNAHGDAEASVEAGLVLVRSLMRELGICDHIVRVDGRSFRAERFLSEAAATLTKLRGQAQ